MSKPKKYVRKSDWLKSITIKLETKSGRCKYEMYHDIETFLNFDWWDWYLNYHL